MLSYFVFEFPNITLFPTVQVLGAGSPELKRLQLHALTV